MGQVGCHFSYGSARILHSGKCSNERGIYKACSSLQKTKSQQSSNCCIFQLSTVQAPSHHDAQGTFPPLKQRTRPHNKKAPKTCFNCRNLKPDDYRSGDTCNARFDCDLSELHQAASNGCEICSFVQAAIGQVFDTEGQDDIHDLSLAVATLPDLFQQFRSGKTIDKVFANTKSSMKIHVGIRDDPKYRNVINGQNYDVILQGQSVSQSVMQPPFR